MVKTRNFLLIFITAASTFCCVKNATPMSSLFCKLTCCCAKQQQNLQQEIATSNRPKKKNKNDNTIDFLPISTKIPVKISLKTAKEFEQILFLMQNTNQRSFNNLVWYAHSFKNSNTTYNCDTLNQDIQLLNQQLELHGIAFENGPNTVFNNYALQTGDVDITVNETDSNIIRKKKTSTTAPQQPKLNPYVKLLIQGFTIVNSEGLIGLCNMGGTPQSGPIITPTPDMGSTPISTTVFPMQKFASDTVESLILMGPDLND